MVLKPHDLGRLKGKVQEKIVLTVLRERQPRGRQSYTPTSLINANFDTALGNVEPVTSIDDRVDRSYWRIDPTECEIGVIFGYPFRFSLWSSDKEVGFGKRTAARRLCGFEVLLPSGWRLGKRIQEYGDRASSRSSNRNPLVFLLGLMDRS